MATSKFPPKIELGAGVLDAIETHAYSNLTAEVGGMLVGDVVNEARHDLEGQFRIGEFLPGGEGLVADTGNGAGQQQAAVFRQPHHHGLGK